MTASDSPTHIAFADESNWNTGQFRSIALVSMSHVDSEQFSATMRRMLDEERRSQFKWEKIAARHGVVLADFFFSRCDRMRVDVLTWHMEDRRHRNLPGRDDRANFARMYYHLIHNVLRERWPNNARWVIYPHEQEQVDWLTLEECLRWKSWAEEENLLTLSGLAPNLREYYNIQEIRPVRSDTAPLVQLTDMFAGLVPYSFASFAKYKHWANLQSETPSLFSLEELGIPGPNLSTSDLRRMPIIHHVRNECGRRKLGVSLLSSGGLRTFDPNSRLNFWLYQPQRKEDRAPIRIRQ